MPSGYPASIYHSHHNDGHGSHLPVDPVTILQIQAAIDDGSLVVPCCPADVPEITNIINNAIIDGSVTFTDENTQLTDQQVQDIINAAINDGDVVFVDTDTHLTEAEITAIVNHLISSGDIVLPIDNDTQLTDAEVLAIINAAITAGTLNLPADIDTVLTAAQVTVIINQAITNGDINLPPDQDTQLTSAQVISIINQAIIDGDITFPTPERVYSRFYNPSSVGQSPLLDGELTQIDNPIDFNWTKELGDPANDQFVTDGINISVKKDCVVRSSFRGYFQHSRTTYMSMGCSLRTDGIFSPLLMGDCYSKGSSSRKDNQICLGVTDVFIMKAGANYHMSLVQDTTGVTEIKADVKWCMWEFEVLEYL